LNLESEDHPTCPGCGKPAYPSERPLLCLGTKWHPGCIKCTVCKVTLTPRMLETYEKKPYCQAHRPSAMATQVADDFHKKQATEKPKAARRQPGVDVTARQTFYNQDKNAHLDQIGLQLHANKQQINPSGFMPDRPVAPNRPRQQGINKLEGTTFNDSSLTNKGGAAPMYSGAESWDNNQSTESTPYSRPPAAAPPPAARTAPPPRQPQAAPSYSAPEETYQEEQYDAGHQEQYDGGQEEQYHDDQGQGGEEQYYDQGQGGGEEQYNDQGQGGEEQYYDQGQGGGEEQYYDQGQGGGEEQYYDQGQGGEYYEGQEGEYEQQY